jgi:ParB family chromosome partitioning protein
METKTAAPKGVYQELKISDIILPAACNPRQDEPKGELFTLRDSLEEIGQLNAVTINHADGKYFMVAGRRRLEAAKQADQYVIEAKVYENLDYKTFLMMLAVENIHRRDFNVIEESRLMKTLNEAGYHEKTIAAKFGMTVDTIRRRLNLLELPDEIKKMMTRINNPLPIHQASMLVKLSESQQLELARKIAPITGPIAGEKQVQQWLDELKGPKLPLDHAAPDDKRPSLSQKKRAENKKGTLPGVKNKKSKITGENPPKFKTPNVKFPKTPKPKKAGDNIKLGEVNFDITGDAVLSNDGRTMSIVFAKTASFFKVNGKEIVADEPLIVFFTGDYPEKITKVFKQAAAVKTSRKGAK